MKVIKVLSAEALAALLTHIRQCRIGRLITRPSVSHQSTRYELNKHTHTHTKATDFRKPFFFSNQFSITGHFHLFFFMFPWLASFFFLKDVVHQLSHFHPLTESFWNAARNGKHLLLFSFFFGEFFSFFFFQSNFIASTPGGAPPFTCLMNGLAIEQVRRGVTHTHTHTH